MDKKEKERSIKEAGITGSATETVQRYGSAVKEHTVAYSGIDNETGQKLSKGLKDIAESKVHPDYKIQNIEQQAGFSAEVKTQARENAEKSIKKNHTSRTIRTDDMSRQPDGKGNTIGGGNERLYDLADVDSNGTYIIGTGRQLKYVGGNADECYNRLMLEKYDKYRDADIPIEIPSDFYDDVQKKLSDRAQSLEKQIQNAETKGNVELSNTHREQLARVRKTQENLRKGKLTNKEAIEARMHPMLSTAKDVGRVAHRAGVQTAKSSAVIGGAVSIVQNLVALVKGEKEMDEAALDVAKDTGSAAALGYGTGAIGATVKGLMQNARSTSVQALSGTNLPGVVVTVALNSAKTLKRYYNAEIDGVECLEELGEQGTGMVSSAMFATIGQIAIPIPVIGGLIGGMVGYAVASASYGALMDSLKDAKVAREDRIRIEQECDEMIRMIREYRLEIERITGEYLSSHIATFQTAFDDMKSSLAIGDVDGFIAGANSISEMFGRKPQFRNMNEFDALMASDEALKL